MDEVYQKKYVKEKEMYLKIKEELEDRDFICSIKENIESKINGDYKYYLFTIDVPKKNI